MLGNILNNKTKISRYLEIYSKQYRVHIILLHNKINDISKKKKNLL